MLSRFWTNQLFDQLRGRRFPACPGSTCVRLALAVGEKQLRYLRLRTAAALVSWDYRCPRVHDVRASRDQVGHKSNRHALGADRRWSILRRSGSSRTSLPAKFPSTCQSNYLKFGKKTHANKAGESVFPSNSFKANKNLCVMTSHAVLRLNWYIELIWDILWCFHSFLHWIAQDSSELLRTKFC